MTTPTATSAIRKTTRRKVLWRLMPFLCLCYLVNYIDRSNISIAGPSGMNQELGLTATAYGFAAGIFFVGYILLEVPSNIALHKFGARVWIARILISWGVVASATAFVPNQGWLIGLRFLLGVAEAGFTPGILLYLTYWFVQRDRAQAFALFLVGIPLSSVIGAPLASWLIALGDGWGFSGWRFMILATGVPAILLGLMCSFYLTDRPDQAKWLSDEERSVLCADLDQEAAGYQSHSIRGVLLNTKVWILCVVYFCIVYGLYAIGFFLPTIIQGFQAQYAVKYSVVDVGLLTAIPYAFATLFLIFWSNHSRKHDEVTMHVAISAVMGAAGILIAIWANSPTLTLVGVSLAAMGLCSAIPISFGVPTKFLTGMAAASGLALINTFGNIGGFTGPFIFGWIHDATGTTTAGMYVIAGLCLIAGALNAFVIRRWKMTADALTDQIGHF